MCTWSSIDLARKGLLTTQVNLPAQLAVDLLHCERAAQQAVAESNGQLRLVQGELITVGYFDNLAAEIDEILQVRLAVSARICACLMCGLSGTIGHI